MGERLLRRCAAFAAAAMCLAAPAAAQAMDRYELANGCFSLRAPDGSYVRKDALGYAASTHSAAAAGAFRFQATALGRYMLYDRGKRMPAVWGAGAVVPSAQPGPEADWELQPSGAAFTLTSVQNHTPLAVGLLGRLVQGLAATPFELVPADACADFPDIGVQATGAVPKGASPDAPVRGFIDDHTHISAFGFLGGQHCGRPWSPYGVTVALRDCDDHYPDGQLAIFEQALSPTPGGRHSVFGWPRFTGWPRWDSLTHEGTYWRWIQRAWMGGLRIVVNDVVENRALCQLSPKPHASCNE